MPAGAVLCMAMLLALPSPAQRLAFPGAEGAGARSAGGRGGKVLYVTNLRDSGPGSLRAACSATGPRIVLFRVSGIISLDSPLVITRPFITIAGQTAPGDGICLRYYTCLVEGTHDVIIRYLRCRPGDGRKYEGDALSVHCSQNVIIDHCSAGWSIDESLSVTGAGTTNVTVQWCIISESLNRSFHRKGPHGYGSLLRVDGELSFHHNLYADNSSRNPRPGCYGNFERGGMLDFRNNVIYNWGERPGYSMEDKISMNYVGNYLKPGPSTGDSVRKLAFMVEYPTAAIFAEKVVLEGTGPAPSWDLFKLRDSSWMPKVRLIVPLPMAEVRTEPAEAAFQRVLDGAGATLPRRDEVDQRVIRQVRENRGKIIDSQNEVGGWPYYASTLPPEDTDNDGMPDAWELSHGLDPRNPADAALDNDVDGYSNIEEYLNSTEPQTPDTGRPVHAGNPGGKK